MKTENSQTMMKYFTEKDSGYPSFRSCGFTEDQIKLIWEQNFYEKLCTVNHIMETNERPPLFSDPSDSYRSAKEYFHLMEETGRRARTASEETGDGSVSPEEGSDHEE